MKISFLLHLESCVLSLVWLQTPVIRGEKEDRFGDVKEILWSILSSKVLPFAILGIVIVVGLYILYKRRKSIPGLEAQVLQKDTWFVTRDDNNRVGIVVSVKISNKTPRGLYITNCKLSGYSARENPAEIHLEGSEKKQKIDFPPHKHYYKGQDFYLGPSSSETLWFYYESRITTMRNVLETPLTIKDSEKRHKTIRLAITRHADQIAMYQEMEKMW